MIEGEIAGEPIVQERPRKGQYGQFYDPSSKKKKDLGYTLLAIRGRQSPLVGSLWLDISFYFADAKRRDLDNMLKAFLDAANGILWEDDSQIIKITAFLMRENKTSSTQFSVIPLESK